MYRTDHNNKERWSHENYIDPVQSIIRNEYVQYTLSTKWEEHCVECAMPECYELCSLYVKKVDLSCERFVYGVFENKLFNGLYGFGADIKFKRWGKLETIIKMENSTDCIQKRILSENNNNERETQWINVSDTVFDEFVFECYSENDCTFILEYFVEVDRKRTSLLKTSFYLKKGYNLNIIPYSCFDLQYSGYLCVYPEHSFFEPRLVILWLDFVKYNFKGYTKIKCVVWDLDNTIWDGILLENDNIMMRSDALTLIKQLDDKGVIQSIVSKNNEKDAVEMLEVFDIYNYFIFPKINWNRKSDNLIFLSKEFNIDLDAFAVIDDSNFERFEIKSQLPQVRVYSDLHIPYLNTIPDFQIQNSTTGSFRRSFFNDQLNRQIQHSVFEGDYDDFLTSCKMNLSFIYPKEEEVFDRCIELLQRSNKLNLSGNKYTKLELRRLIIDENMLPVAIKCSDKFGDYGIVAFICFKLKKDILILSDMAISCRIAQKKVEQATIYSLVNSIFLEHKQVEIFFNITEKNTPLLNAFKCMKFTSVSSINSDTIKFSLNIPVELEHKPIFSYNYDNYIGIKYMELLNNVKFYSD